MDTCPSCGGLAAGPQFCGNCGARLAAQEPPSERDVFFGFFVGLTEKGVFTSITVSVRGTMFSGTLMPAKDYFSKVSSAFVGSVDGLGGDEAIAAAQHIDKFGELQDEAFFHLHSAKVWENGKARPLKGGFVRLRRDSVDAFFLGESN